MRGRKKLFDAKVTARQDLEGAQAALAAAEAEARRSQSAASAAKVSGDGRTLGVVSLISGRVTKADAKLGSYVLAGTELFRVSDPNRIQINASVLAADARRIKPGDTAVIELLGGETVTAVVRSATPSLDPDSKTATIVLSPQGIGGLTAGQGLRARIKPRGGGDSALIALPEEAVQTVEGKEVVFVKTAKGFQSDDCCHWQTWRWSHRDSSTAWQPVPSSSLRARSCSKPNSARVRRSIDMIDKLFRRVDLASAGAWSS